MSRLNPRQARDVVTVLTAAGRSSLGPVDGRGIDLRVVYLPKSQLVRDANGVEVVSEVTLLVSRESSARRPSDLQQILKPGARVSVRGVVREVIKTEVARSRGRDVYLSVTLT